MVLRGWRNLKVLHEPCNISIHCWVPRGLRLQRVLHIIQGIESGMRPKILANPRNVSIHFEGMHTEKPGHTILGRARTMTPKRLVRPYKMSARFVAHNAPGGITR